ncbi:MAG: DUF1761 family protein [Bacteroidota bacterium]
MEQPNWLIIPIAAIIPLLISFIWFHPNVLGNKLAQVTGRPLSEINPKKSVGQLLLIYFLSILLSYIMTLVSVHQVGIFQLFFMEPSFAEGNSEFNNVVNDFMAKYGGRHRSFGHGMLHGAEVSFFLGLSFFGTSAILQGKPFKQVWIPLGFWVVCCSLVAGVVCAFF